ncbi:arylsulfatase [Paenibacillus sp. F411]|uniref:arylsulfatase n=1 Tax=Paenibacillus sp. F411 TaxID=2820239 RepID=UPI001AAEB9D0|nr:arylsulfatase [Paenibacillus sp. F411]MBO2944392.1 arylsulfatase [Paenibacillus sp. F411]
MSAKKPNVILILTDDQGYGDLGLHGNSYVETPRLDALGAEGVRFEQFYATPVCAPTRASLLTGRQFLRTGVWHVHGGRDFLNTDETLLPEVLRDHGYRTGMMGKWHSGKTNAYLPYHRGFDEVWMAKLYVHMNNRMDHNGEWVDTTGWTTDTLTDKAIDFIRSSKEEPFFLYVPYLAPHEPWYAPDELIEKYKSKGLSESLATVFAMIEQVDTQVGRLLDTVREEGLEEDTIVIFMSDNGPIAGSSNLPDLTAEEMSLRNAAGMRGNKGTIWDNGSRVPCFIHSPARFRPTIIEELVHVTDLFPTILELTGASRKENAFPLDGRSLVPMLEPVLEKEPTAAKLPEQPDDRYIVNGTHQTYWPARPNEWSVPPRDRQFSYLDQRYNLSIRHGKYKLVPAGDGRHELYDMEADPRETTDLASELPETTSGLANKLQSWFEELVRSGRAHRTATFYIGYPGEQETVIPTYAPVAVSGHVVPGSHSSKGWMMAGDGQSADIEVLDPGEYELQLRADVLKEGTMAEVSIGNIRIQGVLRSGQPCLLGRVHLEAGRFELTLRLIDVPSGAGDAVSFSYPSDGVIVRRAGRS